MAIIDIEGAVKIDRITDDYLAFAAYDPWELCGLDRDCLRNCKNCHIMKMYLKFAAYEDIGYDPEELQMLVNQEK